MQVKYLRNNFWKILEILFYVQSKTLVKATGGAPTKGDGKTDEKAMCYSEIISENEH